MEILTGAQMRSVDRRAIDEFGIPGLELMESAGRGVAEALLEEYPEAGSCNVVVLCGKGNNGGDGLVAARHLLARGVPVQVVLLAAAAELTGDAALQFRAARKAGVDVREVTDDAAWSAAAHLLEGNPIVLDALLGTGVRGGARGLIARVIEALNAAETTVVAVDLPSGLDTDAPQPAGVVVRAERTYTLCRPKPALLLGPGAEYCGRWTVLDIGIPAACVAAEGTTLEWIDSSWAARAFPPRAVDSHKGSYGHLLIVAGSTGKTGAAVLAGRAALRAGVGLVTVATAASCRAEIAVQQAELMTLALPESPDGRTIAPDAATTVLHALAQRSALAIGPGLGTDPATVSVIGSIVAESRRPTVVDADGLNALDLASLASGASDDRPTLLTPHPGEAARLLGISTAAVQADRAAAVRRLASESGAVVVLKGHRTLVASPAGRLAVNTNGNPGMATAGTGDVLTGLLGALVARGLDGWTAARLGVFLHGAAGDHAAAALGQDSLLASDLLRFLPAAFRGLHAEAGTW